MSAAKDAKKTVEKKVGEVAEKAGEMKESAMNKAEEIKDATVEGAKDAKKVAE